MEAKRTYVHPDQIRKAAAEKEESERLSHLPKDIPMEDITFLNLLDQSRIILRREVMNLALESSTGKLCKDSAQALRDYVKLLKDLSEDEKDTAADLSDADLKKIADGG